jgi:hypothetical protein
VRRVPRTPILVLVGALLLAAVVFQRSDDVDPPNRARAIEADVDPGLPPPDALSASWYCTEGTSSDEGRADETIIVSSVSDQEIAATITVMPGGESAPVSRTVRVDPRREARVEVSEVVATPEPGVVVEVVGGQAAVAHEIRSGDDVAAEPCARRASPTWFFSGGTTVRGTQQHLVLFDPFGDDAIVDVTFLTGSGVQQPDSLQGLVVRQRSRVSIPVHDLVPREPVVGIEVRARTGRVVAERSMIFDGTVPEDAPGRRGLALSLGAVAPQRSWDLPFGSTVDGGSAQLGIANFGATASNVEVEVVLDGDQTLTPLSVSVPARSAVVVDVSDRVPADSQFAVRAFARTVEGRSKPLVVELLGWWPEASSSTAVASTLGAPRAAGRWVVPVPTTDGDVTVTVINPGAGPLTAELLVYGAAGQPPSSAPAAAIGAGRFATFDLGALGYDSGRVVVVVADEPVVVGVTVFGDDGAAFVAGVPDDAYRQPI